MLKEINDIAGKMANMDRFSQTRLLNPESVLEHTGFVCLFSAILSQRLICLGENINIGEVMMKAVLHDVEEVLIGDIPTPTKYANKTITDSLREASILAADEVLSKVDQSGKLFDYWLESKEGRSGYIVSIADRLSVLYKANQEISLFGNNTIKGHVVSLAPAIESLKNRVNMFESEESVAFIWNLINEALELCECLR